MVGANPSGSLKDGGVMHYVRNAGRDSNDPDHIIAGCSFLCYGLKSR